MARKDHSKKHRQSKASQEEAGGRVARTYASRANRTLHEEAEKVRAKRSTRERDLDFSYTQNREVSWLRFNNRVLDEALDPTVPLFERLKFCAIFQSNLDEWFMIRVGGLSDLATLKRQPVDNKSDMTPSEQLEVIFSMLPAMVGRQQGAFSAIEENLARFGLVRVDKDAMDDADRVAVHRHFRAHVAPIISPLVVDPRHPFPNLRNGQLYVMCALETAEEGSLLGLIEIPQAMPRVVELPSGGSTFRYTLIEDVIAAELDDCFAGYNPTSAAVVRVTRNADMDPDGDGLGEEEDYRQHMKKVLKRRLRLQPVRVEFQGTLDKALEELVREELDLEAERLFRTTVPLDLSYVYGLESKLPANHRSALLFDPFEPQLSPMVDPARPVREQVMDHDVLLYYPYESMRPLLDLLHQASEDDACISIRITLYRVARRSRLCESLITAAENGKDVTVLMELRARFDEQNNIEWAERLEAAGCTVIYGSEGFKCHSKICQITYHDDRGISRITCLGTGNFNEKTARLYCDFMLMTAHEGIGEDGNLFFRNLTLGNLQGSYRHLGVAPTGLKPLIMRGIDREIARAKAGQPARVFLKMNSCTDRDVIDRIAEATQAGVDMVLIVRGICCIKPDIAGRTDGLVVHQIVGRLLEHSRVYAFGAEADTVYLSSADMMTRNTERRVEIAYPVLDPTCRAMVLEYMNLQMVDNVKARRLTAEGTWASIPAAPGSPLVNSQECLIALAYHHALEASAQTLGATPLTPELAALPPDVVGRLITLGALTRQVQPMTGAEPLTEPVPMPVEQPEGPESVGTDVAMAEDVVEAPDAPEPSQDQPATAAGAPKPIPLRTEAHVAEGFSKENPAPLPKIPTVPSQGEVCVVSPPEPQADGRTEAAQPPSATGSAAPDEMVTAIVRRKHGRLETAISLIGAGVRTLILGADGLTGQGHDQAAEARKERQRAERAKARHARMAEREKRRYRQRERDARIRAEVEADRRERRQERRS